MFEYKILVDDNSEAESLERAFMINGARINQEGWTTSYGGTGITMFVECSLKKRDVKQFLTCCPSAQLLEVKKLG